MVIRIALVPPEVAAANRSHHAERRSMSLVAESAGQICRQHPAGLSSVMRIVLLVSRKFDSMNFEPTPNIMLSVLFKTCLYAFLRLAHA